MTLQEIYDQLLSAELSQSGGFSEGPDNLSDTDALKLVGHINLGLTALYRRFNLKQRQMLFPLQPDITQYALELDDFLKLEAVQTEDEYRFPLNDSTDPWSCHTPTIKSLRVPRPLVTEGADVPDRYKTEQLLLTYRANHPALVPVDGYMDPETELELPPSHVMALLLFVAARVHSPLGVGQVEGFSSTNWYGRYEAECLRLQMESLEVTEEASTSRLHRAGWA
jgi:hypothetical protein